MSVIAAFWSRFCPSCTPGSEVMHETFRRKRRGLLISILAGLGALALVFSVFIYVSQSRQLVRTHQETVARERDLIADVLTDFMLRHDYAEARAFLEGWPRAHPEVNRLRVTMNNGKVFFLYGNADSPVDDSLVAHRTVQYAERALTFSLSHDTQEMQHTLAWLALELVLFSLTVVAMTGLALWYVLFRWIVHPLEQGIADRTRALADSEANLRQINRVYRALSACNLAVSTATEEQALLEQGVAIIHRDCGYRMVWIGYAENDAGCTVSPVAQAGWAPEYTDGVKVRWDDSARGQGPIGTAIRERRAVIIENTLTDARFRPWRKAAERHGFHSCAAFPLEHENTVLGTVAVYAEVEDAFSPAEVGLLRELARNLAFGVFAVRNRVAREEAQRALEKVSVTDHLTQLFNRLKTDEVLAGELNRAERYGQGFSLVLSDVDHFKAVNDIHGHQAGDAVLKAVADVFQANMRAGDTVGRWGGEEFLILCPGTGQEGAVALAEKLRQRVQATETPPVGAVTASFGVAAWRAGDDEKSLIARVDKALYAAKRQGRNRVVTA